MECDLKQMVEFMRPYITEESYKNLYNNKIFDILRQYGVLVEKDGMKNVPAETYLEKKYFRIELRRFEEEKKDYCKVFITNEGALWIKNSLLQAGIIVYRDESIPWTDCDFNWFMNEYNEQIHELQYFNNNDIWTYISIENTRLKMIIGLYRNNRPLRYRTKEDIAMS